MSAKFKVLVAGILVFSTFLPASFAMTGGMDSGGGEVLKGTHNPWFVQNSTDVTYCLSVDKKHFHQSDEVIDRRIRDALAYWKQEFSRSISPTEHGVSIKVATQTFHRVSCKKDVDLRFQLGWLTRQQQRDIGDPTKYIAFARRETYDLVNLRGRGFIYISADSGPLKPNDDQLISNPWTVQDGALLFRVIAHELGHVFGIPDTAAFPATDGGLGLMSAAYPEYALNKLWATQVGKQPALPPFFSYSGSEIQDPTCVQPTLSTTISKFFGIPPSWQCYEIRYDSGALQVFARESIESAWHLMGTATLEPHGNFRWSAAVTLWLPPEQKVYAHVPSNEYLFGPMINYSELKGTYRTTNGSLTRSLFITLPLNGVWPRIGGILDGELLLNIGWGQ